MNKSDSKKKVVVTTATTPRATPTAARTSRTSAAPPVRRHELIFGKRNYMLMLAGIGAIALGLMLMSGGAMPSTDVWDESIIYSTRRTLLGPAVIIVGLVLEIVAIFSNPNPRRSGDATL